MCNELPTIVNGMISYTSDSEGPEYDLDTIATYSCDDGYMLIGSNSSRQCQISSTDNTVAMFSGTAPVCERVAIMIMFDQSEYSANESDGRVIVRVVTDRMVEGPVTFFIVGGEQNKYIIIRFYKYLNCQDKLLIN